MKDNYDYQDLLVNSDLSEIDPLVDELIKVEEDRQARKLIMIPSESVSPLPVRDALGSVFNNIYSEGYPRDAMREELETDMEDLTRQFTHYRRYANRRFYKGTELVDIVESLAGIRAKQAHATKDVPPEDIYVNVQPLSGTPANLAVYDSFVEPGGTVMGLALDQGGHLSHGSEFNLTGKRYNIVSYSTDPHTGRLDYDQIRDLALEHEPEMIITGYTSYSWAPDWDKFSEIAEEVGAVLLADIAHVAGMSIAGAYPSPIGKADVVMHTTHKTLAGPRGAVVLTTDPDKAEILDEAIFPGAQGGPHPNKFAAMAVAFEIAQTKTYQDLQHQMVDNAKALAEGLQERGLTLAYGGTDTHLLVVNLKELEQELDFTPMGEIVSRILDEARIVSNKNTIPGDESAAEAHGLRLGTPWITQRGMKEPEMDEIADIIAEVLHGIKSFEYIGQISPLSRGKIDMDLLMEARERVANLLADFPPYPEGEEEYPEYYPVNGKIGEKEKAKEKEAVGTVDPDWPRSALIEISGHRPTAFLDQISTREILDLEGGNGKSALLLDENGDVLDEIEIVKKDQGDSESYLVISSPERKGRVLDWFRGISDGYITFDRQDYMKKVEGPVKVYDLEDGNAKGENFAVYGPVNPESLFESVVGKIDSGTVSSVDLNGEELAVYRSEQEPEDVYFWLDPENLKALADELELEADVGEDYSGRPGHEVYHEKKELFDLVRPYFVGQRVLENELDRSEFPEGPEKVFSYDPEESEEAEKSTPLLDKHEELGAKIAPFVGWEMPFWYSTIQDEHRAVRETAGLFDVGHMAVYEIKGEGATHFLDCVTSNYIRWLDDKEAQYNYFLDPEGRVIDDAMVYRINAERYIIVSNAVNEEKVWNWLQAVESGDYVLDHDRPWVKPSQIPEVVNLKSEDAGGRALRDLALQGPNSRKILQELTSPEETRQLETMLRNELDFYDLNGARTMVARTGYTGEEVGYELLVPPDDAPKLWDDLLDQGEKYGIKPAGLGARDSTRIEAGLPLYGHELSGEDEILPTEAVFGYYVKFHKPFFIGRDRYKEKAKSFDHVDKQIIRFQVTEEGSRMIREESPVFDDRGKYLGYVTSCAKTGEGQVGMAYVKKGKKTEEERKIMIVPSYAGKDEVNIDIGPKARVPISYEAEI
ncbi:glycine cleavage system aminomethyltransferase GcvT, partial [Candidatus Bipolaricaulota bacterium]|nr:glycine cleavage system aminomethyltransferase GcvT [Candidatus Bipolaricaulota bacterium]